jgi:hypothetical protein
MRGSTMCGGERLAPTIVGTFRTALGSGIPVMERPADDVEAALSRGAAAVSKSILAESPHDAAARFGAVLSQSRRDRLGGITPADSGHLRLI